MKTDQTQVEHYLAMRYPVTLRELAIDEGGGFLATIPQLGSKTFIADGDTPEEALAALDGLRRMLIPELLAQNVPLPLPQYEENEDGMYSGNLNVRIPSSLHAALFRRAKKNKTSINKLITQFISEGLTVQTGGDILRELSASILAEVHLATQRTDMTIQSDKQLYTEERQALKK